jgi:hypothetical protein
MKGKDANKNTFIPLQNIIFTDYSVTSQTALYYRVRGQYQYDYDTKTISLCQNASIAFNTLFNSFDYYKWKKYTWAKNIFLKLLLQGKFKIILKSEKYGLDDAQTRIFYFDSSLDEKTQNPFINLNADPLPADNYPRKTFLCSFEGMESFPHLYFEIVALSDNALLSSGEYCACLDDAPFSPRPVFFALNIYAQPGEETGDSLLRLCADAANNPASPLRGMFRAYAGGSGSGTEREAAAGIRRLSGANAGEAGGFARAILESLKDRENIPLTHMLTLRSNAVVSGATLVRLKNFLALLREDYSGAVVSAARMDAGLRYKQLYSGAFGTAQGFSPLKALYDLRDFTLVKKNGIAEKINMAPWDGSCYPFSCLRENDLPLPLFAGRWDAEFSQRAARGFITVNGICCWGDDTAGKVPASAESYLSRNTYIVNAVRGQPGRAASVKLSLRRKTLGHIFRLSYKSGELMLDGFEDFCQGVDWLKKQNPADLHKKILRRAPRELPIEQQAFAFTYGNYELDQKPPPRPARLGRCLRRLTLNGLLLPPRPGRTKILAPNAGSGYFYRLRSVFFYDENSQTGYLSRWNRTAAWSLLARWRRLRSLADSRFEAACKEYKERWRELADSAFWKEYLRLKDDAGPARAKITDEH